MALYPNPFFGVANGTYIDSGNTFLQLVDGGEDGQVIPIQPLLVKARNVDVLVAIDGVCRLLLYNVDGADDESSQQTSTISQLGHLS